MSNLDPSTLSITDQAAAVQKAMADMVKLQATKQAKRTGDKENDTIDSVNWGTALCYHMTAICYHVMAIYHYLPFFASTCLNKPNQERQAQNLKPVTAKPTDLTSSRRETCKTVDTKDQYATQCGIPQDMTNSWHSKDLTLVYNLILLYKA